MIDEEELFLMKQLVHEIPKKDIWFQGFRLTFVQVHAVCSPLFGIAFTVASFFQSSFIMLAVMMLMGTVISFYMWHRDFDMRWSTMSALCYYYSAERKR